MKRFVPRLTYANVMVTVLAFLVLGGGTAYATGAIPPGSVGTEQLANGAVTAPKLAMPSVNNGKIADNAINSAKIAPHTVLSTDIATGTIAASNLSAEAKESLSGPKGYAHFHEGDLIAAQSKGVIAVSEGKSESGSESDPLLICFHLSFTPASISVTPEVVPTNSNSVEGVEFAGGAIPAYPPFGSAGQPGCPEGFRDAEVQTFTPRGNPPFGLWVVFY